MCIRDRSYHIENLTEEIYNQTMNEITKIEAIGGALSAIEQGYQQQEIHTTAYRYYNEIEKNTRRIVGVNHGVLDEDIKVQPMKLNPKVTEQQHQRLRETRNSRDSEAVKNALTLISNACSKNENLFPLVIEAVKLNATLGEIMKAMKDVFGTYMAPSGF